MFKLAKKMVLIVTILAVFTFLLTSAPGLVGKAEPPNKIDLLIVDETKTLGLSMRVEVLARAINKMGIFNLSAKIVDVESSYQVPLAENSSDKQCDLILLFPRGLDDGTVNRVWILSPAINWKMNQWIVEGINTLSSLVEKIFQVKPLDVSEAFFPALLAGALAKKGWFSSWS